jgi:mersacidin/lichenicidin family type 2 lantibiotic
MNHELLTRAREDPSTLPETPSGRPLPELEDDELGGVVGGRQYELVNTAPRPRFNSIASDISNGFRHGR